MDHLSEQRSALIRITGFAERDLATMLEDLPIDDWSEAIETFCESYGLAAGTLAADWYDDLREAAEAPGKFFTEPARLPSAGLYRAIVDKLSTTERGAAIKVAQGEVQRVVANAHRDTITQLSGRDRAAHGWRRIGDGANCDFCRMLIGRGAVYTESTARFASHQHCNCMAAPDFDGGRSIGVMPYSRSTDRQSATARAASARRVHAWIAKNQT